MPFPDLAVKQLEDAMRKPGIRGAAIGGSVLGASSAIRARLRLAGSKPSAASCGA